MNESLEMAKAHARYEATKALYELSGEAPPFRHTLKALSRRRRRAVRASLNNLTIADLATIASARGRAYSIEVADERQSKSALGVPWWV